MLNWLYLFHFQAISIAEYSVLVSPGGWLPGHVEYDKYDVSQVLTTLTIAKTPSKYDSIYSTYQAISIAEYSVLVLPGDWLPSHVEYDRYDVSQVFKKSTIAKTLSMYDSIACSTLDETRIKNYEFPP